MDEFISTLTTKDLQKILKSRGLSYSYRLKTDLIQRLKDSLKKGEDENSISFILEQDEEEDEFKDSQTDMATTIISFRDVEDALEKFTGETTRSVQEWIKNYEDVAKTCGWNDVHKYLFAHKLLQGAARKSIEADDYAKLVEKLKKEFE